MAPSSDINVIGLFDDVEKAVQICLRRVPGGGAYDKIILVFGNENKYGNELDY